MRIDLDKYITEPGSKLNEDCIGFGENFGLLLDGSTGLRKGIIPETASDAKWFVESFRDIIIKNIDNDKPLPDIVRNGISEMEENLNGLGLGDIDKVDKPSASMVLIRQIKNKLEIFSLGDCTTLIEKAGGEIIKVYDDSVSRLDKKVLNKIIKLSKEKNISVSETKKYVSEDLIRNRYKKNTKEGYWILGFNKAAADYAYYKKWDLNEIKSLCFFSDGFGDFYENMNLAEDYEGFYSMLKKTDINEMYKELRKKQQEDLGCNKHPRLKAKDDASILFYSVKRDIT
ncbi:MAG: hypothetical protein LIR50_20890 [Bacillota bacterium]|nr:hypothetical protein [Bacillota bacterium]